MSNDSQHSNVQHRLRQARNLLLRTQVATGVSKALSVASGVVLLAMLLELALHLPVVARTFTAIISISLIAASLLAFVLPPLLRFFGITKRPDEEEIALLVGKRYPIINDALSNALQIKRLHAGSSSLGYSMDLVDAAFENVGRLSHDLDFNAAIDKSELQRAMLWLAPSLMVPAALFIFFGEVREAGFRLANFSQSFAPPLPFTFEISPGNVKRIRGDSVTVTIRTVGPEPQHEIVLQTKEIDQQDARPNVLRSTNGIFSFTIDGVKRSTEYFAEAKGETSEQFTISVIDRPEVKSLSLRLIYPSYTHTPAIDLDENAGDIVGLDGTQAQFSIKSNRALASATISFIPDSIVSDSGKKVERRAPSNVALRVDEMEAHGTFVVNGSGTYTIHLADPDSIGNSQPIEYHVTALRDEFPTIHVLQPQEVTDITETSKLGIVTRIHDDFGFSKMVLHYRLSQSKFANPWQTFKEANIPLTTEGKTDIDIPYIWNLEPFGLVPEDAMEFYVEIFDNDIIRGPKSARSEMLTLRLPSLEAALRESDQSQSDAQQNLQEAEKAAEDLQQQMEQSTRELRQQAQEKNLSWQEQKKMQDLLKKQENLQSKVEEAQQKLEESVNKLEEKQALSPETMQKYMELQKLFQELKSPELMNAMKRLQDAMEKVSPDQMRAAMKNFQVNEEQFKASIERTMAMLKRIQAEQKIDELMKRADELAQQQDKVSEQTKNAQSREDRDKAAAEQRDLQQRTNEMKKEADALQKKMSELGKDMPNQEMQQASDQMQQDAPEQEMQDAQQQMANNPMSAEQHQQKAQQGLKNFKQNMSAVKKKMQENQQKMNMTEMRKSMQDLLDLSKQEESLQQQTQQSESNSSAMPEQAKQQANLQSDLGNVVNRMMKLAQKSFAVTPEMGKELGKGLREMQSATGNLEQRQPPQACQNEGNAVGGMNAAAKMMQEALSQMGQGQGQPGGSGGGMQSFMQQLNQMAGEQESINGQTEKLGNSGQLNMQQQAEMQRLSNQQQAVRQSLEQLKKQQEEMTGGKKNTLGDLNKIEDEMQEVINDMKSSNVRPETIQRQERILSRLLDAQRSQHERDFDKKREGKAGSNVTRESPAQLPDFQKLRSLDEILRLQEAGYSKDYERRIKKYFESLQGNTPQ